MYARVHTLFVTITFFFIASTPIKFSRMTSVPARPHPPLSPTPPMLDPLHLKKVLRSPTTIEKFYSIYGVIVLILITEHGPCLLYTRAHST